MSLSPVANPPWETVRGVRFAMLDGPTLVAVLITHAALDDIEAGASGHLARFDKHRTAIERIANGKHQRGEIEEGGAVVVNVGDLKSSSA